MGTLEYDGVVRNIETHTLEKVAEDARYVTEEWLRVTIQLPGSQTHGARDGGFRPSFLVPLGQAADFHVGKPVKITLSV